MKSELFKSNNQGEGAKCLCDKFAKWKVKMKYEHGKKTDSNTLQVSTYTNRTEAYLEALIWQVKQRKSCGLNHEQL